jgi:hypothetical protein
MDKENLDFQSCISSFIVENKSLRSLRFHWNITFVDFHKELIYNHHLIEFYPKTKEIEIILQRNRKLEKIKGSKIQNIQTFDIKFLW